MSASIRPVLSGKALAFPLSSLILLLVLACVSASAPITQEPRESAGTSVADGNVRIPGEVATPTPPSTSEATSERIEDNQAMDNDAKDTSEAVQRSGGTGGDDQAPAIPDKGELKYPNLGSRLDQLVARVEAGETTAEQAASDSAVYNGASVAVTIYLSGNLDEVVAFLEENGGDPRNSGEDYIEAYVPVSLLGPVSELPGVIRVREIIPPAPGSRG